MAASAVDRTLITQYDTEDGQRLMVRWGRLALAPTVGADHPGP